MGRPDGWPDPGNFSRISGKNTATQRPGVYRAYPMLHGDGHLTGRVL